MLNTVSSQREGLKFESHPEFSIWSLHFLPVSVWVLPQVLQLPPTVPKGAVCLYMVLRLTGDLSRVWPHLHPKTAWIDSSTSAGWVGGWVDGICVKFNPFSLYNADTFPLRFPTVGQTGWAPPILNEKNRKCVILTENTLTHSSPPPALPFTKSSPDWAVCSFLTMFSLQVRDFLILRWLGLHILPHWSKECL